MEQGVEFVAGSMGDLPIINAFSQYPKGINGTTTDMETNLNSSTVSNLVNNVQGADFQEQLKGINDELKKYDHVEGFKDSQEANTLKEGSVQSTKHTKSGLKSLGLDLSTVTTQDEGKIKSRGWVHKDRIISEPIMQSLSLLIKRTHKGGEEKDSGLEVSKKKVAKENTMTTVATGSQPYRH